MLGARGRPRPHRVRSTRRSLTKTWMRVVRCALSADEDVRAPGRNATQCHHYLGKAFLSHIETEATGSATGCSQCRYLESRPEVAAKKTS